MEAFVKEYAQYTGTDYCVGVSTGTAALEMTLRALDIGYGDEVVIPAYAPGSLAAAVVMTGAFPVMCDVGADFNLDPECFKSICSQKTRAVVCCAYSRRFV